MKMKEEELNCECIDKIADLDGINCVICKKELPKSLNDDYLKGWCDGKREQKQQTLKDELEFLNKVYSNNDLWGIDICKRIKQIEKELGDEE